MGCVQSLNQVRPRAAADDTWQCPSRLSDRQVEILKDTWHMINEETEETGLNLLHRFFDNSRDIKFLFARFATIPSDDLQDASFEIDDTKLAVHAQMLMEAFEACIGSLGDSKETSELLIETLVSSGGTHAATYGVRPYMFKPLWFALQSTLEDQLLDVYTSEVEEAWASLFQFLADHMLQGMRLHLPDEDLSVQIR